MTEEKQQLGAEAKVIIKQDKVVKDRLKKKYRHTKLDNRLRSERTEEESRRLSQAKKYGVKVPDVLKTEEYTLEIEKVKGKKLRDIIKNNVESFEDLGRQVGILHNQDIIHGDLTTSNIIIQKETLEPYLIDFGLSGHSQRIEDKAVDLHLLKQVLETSHPEVADDAWSNFIKGYETKQEESEEILDRLEEVEERGRYK